jgi:hypothetical protein
MTDCIADSINDQFIVSRCAGLTSLGERLRIELPFCGDLFDDRNRGRSRFLVNALVQIFYYFSHRYTECFASSQKRSDRYRTPGFQLLPVLPRESEQNHVFLRKIMPEPQLAHFVSQPLEESFGICHILYLWGVRQKYHQQIVGFDGRKSLEHTNEQEDPVATGFWESRLGCEYFAFVSNFG